VTEQEKDLALEQVRVVVVRVAATVGHWEEGWHLRI
jgi:hypothetical protein